MEEKWHKKCGGKVVYREPSEKGAGFKQAGYCLKCDEFPILQEDIIFKLEDGKFERLTKDKWEVLEYKDLPETLDGVNDE